MPPVSRSMTRPSSSGGRSDAPTLAATQRRVPAVRRGRAAAADRIAANTPLLLLCLHALSLLSGFRRAGGTPERTPSASSCVPTAVFPSSIKIDLPHLRKMVQPVRNKEHDVILRVVLQVGEHRVLGFAVKRGERIVQNEDADAGAQAFLPARAAAPARRKDVCRRCRSWYRVRFPWRALRPSEQRRRDTALRPVRCRRGHYGAPYRR